MAVVDEYKKTRGIMKPGQNPAVTEEDDAIDASPKRTVSPSFNWRMPGYTPRPVRRRQS